MKRLKLFLLAILMIISSLTFAQEKVDMTPKISGFAQFPFMANFDKDFKLTDNSLNLQRVCLNFDGKITDKLSWKIGGDFVRNPILVDAFLKYKFNDELAIQVGQFKTPLTIENQFNPAVDCEIYDYGHVIKNLVGYNHKDDISKTGELGRDIGIMATGSLFEISNNKGENFKLIDYKMGIFNGNGIITTNSKTDNNNDKVFIGRLDIHPMIKDLTVSASMRNGMYVRDTTTYYGVLNRYSFGIQYKNEKIVVRSEFIKGETGRIISDETGASVMDHMQSNGFYAVAGYWFNICKTQKIMPVIRYERLDVDESVEKGAISYYTAGIYYMPIKYVNFKLNYQLMEPEKGDQKHTIVAILNFKF